jgi:phage terminase large subunit-like protein
MYLLKESSLRENPFDAKKFPNCRRGHQYALDIVHGKITACIYIIGACKRYLQDIEDNIRFEKDDVTLHERFYFNPHRAERYLKLTQKFAHPIGNDWKTKNIVKEPWQCWIWMNIMGFISLSTRKRRFRIAHLDVARGNGKSTDAGTASLYFMALDDNPQGNQVATVATKRDQARLVFDSAKVMALKNPKFCDKLGVKVQAHEILQPKTNSKIRALSSEHKGLDGLNDILAICDELHAMRREIFEVIYSGMSKRSDSLTLCITTAGFDIDSVGYTQSYYARRVALGEVDDEQFFAAVYTLDEERTENGVKIEADDWTDENNWIKANPNLGVSVDINTFRAKIEKAKVTPSDQTNVKVKHLNMWITDAKAFFNLEAWGNCADPNLRIDDFRGLPCRMGIDLASHIDLTTIALVFYRDQKYFLFEKTFIPEGSVKLLKSVMYDEWIANGYLIQTPGNAINNDFIREEAEKLVKLFRVQECLYDTWNATEMAQKLSNKVEMVKFGMNVGNLSEPMKKLDAYAADGKIVHNGSPLMRWCMGNVVAKYDHNDNVYPRKNHVKLKIDPVIATLMALAGWLQSDQKESAYEFRGLRSI